MNAPLSAQQRDWILEARSRARRSALRLGAGNDVGVTRDDLMALAEDALFLAAQRFSPDRGVQFTTYAYKRVRGLVLRTLSARRWELSVVSLAGDPDEGAPADDRALLDDLDAGIDADACDPFEDSSEDFAREAQAVADDGLLVLVLGRIARSAGTAEKLLLGRELLEQLEAARATLPPDAARVVRMRFDDERTLAEIAEATGTPLTTLHRQLGEILRLLRQRLEGVERRP